ncbi:unnamed protein product, partial [Tetraodon nigroviridis]
KRSRIAYSDEVRNELLGDDAGSSENQRAHLLDNTEKLERSSRRLQAGYQIAVETGYNNQQSLKGGSWARPEQVGQEVLANLHTDREKIQRARERRLSPPTLIHPNRQLRETDANLGKSSRILTGMLRSQNIASFTTMPHPPTSLLTVNVEIQEWINGCYPLMCWDALLAVSSNWSRAPRINAGCNCLTQGWV